MWQGTKRTQWQRLPELVKAILYMGLGGIIGSYALNLFSWTIALLEHGQFNWLALVLITASVAAFPTMRWFAVKRQCSKLAWRLERYEKLQKADAALLSYLSEAAQRPDRYTMDDLLKKLLHHIVQIIPTTHIARAVILHPNTTRRALIPWASYEMPSTSLDSMRFDIRVPMIQTSKTTPRAVAAQTFLDGKIRWVQFEPGKTSAPAIHASVVCDGLSYWTPDTDAIYISHDDDGDTNPRYASFVVIPITDEHGVCLAVICLDSPDRETFSDVQLVPLYEIAASRVCVAIKTFEGLPQVADHKDDTVISLAVLANSRLSDGRRDQGISV